MSDLVARVGRGRVPGVLFALAVAALVVPPLYELQRLALSSGGRGYEEAVDPPWIGEVVVTTAKLSIGALVTALVLGTGLAWLARGLPNRWGWLQVIPVVPLLLPGVATVAGWTFLFSPRIGYGNELLRKLPWWSDLRSGPIDVFTLPWITVLTGIGLSSFVYLFVNAALRNLNPEVIEAALASGASRRAAFIGIVLPILRPALIYASAVCMLLALGQFTAPLLLGRTEGVRVVTTEMYRRIAESPVNFGAAAALSTPLVVIGIVLVLVQQFLLRDESRFVSQTGRAARGLGRPSRTSAVLLTAYGIVAAGLPILAILLAALSPAWDGDIHLSELTLRHISEALEEERVTRAVRNSVQFTLTAIAITIPLGYAAARFISRRDRSPILRAVLDTIVGLPLGVPAVVFGAGFLFAYTGAPVDLYGSKWVVILVYTTIMLPFATRMQLSGMVALGPTYSEAARTCGAGAWTVHLRVLVPLLRSSIGGAMALMFILLSHEFAASLLVRGPRTQVMGTVLYDELYVGQYPRVAAIALVMAFITLIGMVVAFVVGGRSVVDRL